MQRRSWLCQSITGAAIPACSITVYTAGTTTKATIYGDVAGSSALGNPFTSGSDGTYSYYAANGRYTEVLSASGFTFGAAQTQDFILNDPVAVPPATATQVNVGAFNVKSYGAKGDGTTDDSAAFQSACTAAAGKVLYMPTATYLLNGAACTSVAAGTTIIGDGPGRTILKRGAYTGDLFTLATNGTDITFSNFEYNGNRVSTDAAGNQLIQGASNVRLTLDRLYAHDYTDKIVNLFNNNPPTNHFFRLTNSAFVNSFHRGVMSLGGATMVIANNQMSGMNDSGIDLINCDNAVIVGNTVVANGTTETINDGIQCNAGNDLLIAGNNVTITTAARGIWVNVGDSTRTAISGVTIVGNHVTAAGATACIQVEGAPGGLPTSKVLIQGNQCDGGPIALFDAASATIANNQLAGTDGSIQLNNTSLSGADYFITGNFFEKPNQAPIQLQNSTGKTMDQVRITGNYSKTVTLANGRQGMVYGAGTAPGSITNVIVDGNTFFGAVNKVEGSLGSSFFRNNQPLDWWGVAGRYLQITPTVTASGNRAIGLNLDGGTLTAAANTDILAITGDFGSGNTIATGAFTGLTASTFTFGGANLVKTGTGTIDNAATIIIRNAPTIGTTNYALLSQGGRVDIQGNGLVMGSATGGDKGAGTINIATGGGYYINGVQIATMLLTNASGTIANAAHMVQDTVTLAGGTAGVALAGAAAFANANSYTCVCDNDSAVLACRVVQNGGNGFTLSSGAGSDVVRFICVGS